MEEKNTEEKSILFIGNGFDLRYGRKTKFSDFMETRYDLKIKLLEEIKKEYDNIKVEAKTKSINKFVNHLLNKKEQEILSEIKEKKDPNLINVGQSFYLKSIISLEEYIDLIGKKDFWNEIKVKKVKGIYNVEDYFQDFIYDIKENIKKIEEIENLTQEYYKKINKWIIYFQHLKYSIKVEDKYKNYINWFDVENIIKLNFSSQEESFPDSNFLFKDQKEKFESFKEFKLLLSEYLSTQNEDIVLKSEDYFTVESYKKIINFNYTTLNGYLNKNIHGELDDGVDIVLGFDESELFVKEGVSLDTEAVRYTKVDQLIELYKENNDLDNIFNIEYDRLGIYGLSMGEADYSYYTTIILNNIKNIKVTVYYINGDESKGEFNNKYELREAFYHLIKHIEKVSGKQLYHNMVISGRIEFIPRTPLKNN